MTTSETVGFTIPDLTKAQKQIGYLKAYIGYLEECERYNAMVPPEFQCEYPEALLAKGKAIRAKINPENLPDDLPTS